MLDSLVFNSERLKIMNNTYRKATHAEILDYISEWDFFMQRYEIADNVVSVFNTDNDALAMRYHVFYADRLELFHIMQNASDRFFTLDENSKERYFETVNECAQYELDALIDTMNKHNL